MSEPLDINLDLSGTTTTVPMIADGSLVRARLAKVEQVQKDAGKLLKFEFHILDPAPTSDGSQVNPGFPLFVSVPLYAREGAKNPNWYMEKIAKIMDGLLGTGDKDNKKGKPERPAFNSESVAAMIGQEVILKVTVRTGEYEGNDVASFTHPSEVVTGA